MKKQIKIEDSVNTRYFLACTVGKSFNGNFSFNSFDIKTTNDHPTYKRCIELSNELFPNLRDVTLISFSEISEADWLVFISEK
jgi:ABC-type uncharacterized transport system substrate-binding protein